ncbi:MAG TPA: hypothetical protein ENN69_06715, partial [Spirochaetia bacterium]|nr:hypothetical protein [Spirochaetia bacterium]
MPQVVRFSVVFSVLAFIMCSTPDVHLTAAPPILSPHFYTRLDGTIDGKYRIIMHLARHGDALS